MIGQAYDSPMTATDTGLFSFFARALELLITFGL